MRVDCSRAWAGSYLVLLLIPLLGAEPAGGQLVDRHQSPNTANEGIAKTLAEQVGAGRGDVSTKDSSLYLIARDPFRAIRRGRQLFQRKFTLAEGLGPRVADGSGDMNKVLALGAGLTDSCAACHGRPRGSAGTGGSVVTRPDSRDAPHLFGAGLKEMLASEMTADLRALRSQALARAAASGRSVTVALASKGIAFGSLTARADGFVDSSRVEGVDPDLRVRPFFAQGGEFSLRAFVVGALQNEMGLQAADPDLAQAAAGGRVTTPSGLVLDGAHDRVDAPPAQPGADPDHDGILDEVPTALVDDLEFYLLNYFKPGIGQQTAATTHGRKLLHRIGCTGCHVPTLVVAHDRRVADVETVFDAERGILNRLFATATLRHATVVDSPGLPPRKAPLGRPFAVRNFFSDLKRHDLGPSFHERNYDGSTQNEFLTAPLWGVATTAPYGHDGRSISLEEVILRHGGEALQARDAFALLPSHEQAAVLAFLQTLVLFPPDDVASNLSPGDRTLAGFPQVGHGSIKLSVLFNDPADAE